MKPNMVTIHIDFYISHVILANHESYEWDDRMILQAPLDPSIFQGATRRRSEVSGRTAAMPASRRSGTGRRRAGTRWDYRGVCTGCTTWG